MKTRILLLAAITTAVLSQNALACGDSLYRVGKGTLYRTYTTPLPGNLLVYATSPEGVELAQMMADSGHSVILVDDSGDLTSALKNGAYDVVIAPFEQRSAVAAAGELDVAFLPVAMSKQEHELARQQYTAVLSSDDSIKRFLKTIHKTLKSRA